MAGVRVTPNPARGSIEATVGPGGMAPVTAAILDLQGRLVRSLDAVTPSGGESRVRWDGLDASGRSVAAGIYLIRIETEGRRFQSKVVRIR